MDRSCPLTEVYIFSHFGRRIVSGVVHLSPLCLGASVDRVGRCILSGDGPFLSPVRDAILVCMHTVFGVGLFYTDFSSPPQNGRIRYRRFQSRSVQRVQVFGLETFVTSWSLKCFGIGGAAGGASTNVG